MRMRLCLNFVLSILSLIDMQHLKIVLFHDTLYEGNHSSSLRVIFGGSVVLRRMKSDEPGLGWNKQGAQGTVFGEGVHPAWVRARSVAATEHLRHGVLAPQRASPLSQLRACRWSPGSFRTRQWYLALRADFTRHLWRALPDIRKRTLCGAGDEEQACVRVKGPSLPISRWLSY